MSEQLYTVGKIVNTHGIRGELKIVPDTHFPERFDPESKLVIVDLQNKQTPVTVLSARLHKNMYIVKFKGYDNINEVEKYKGGLLKVEEKYQGELDEGEYYYHQIIGCTVVSDDGTELGVVSEILSPGANDVWVVSKPKSKPVLIPVIDEVVLDVDVSAKLIKIHILEGLLD